MLKGQRTSADLFRLQAETKRGRALTREAAARVYS
jgi:hypothetical protein